MLLAGLLLGKFSKKCKQAVRCIKLRAERIKKKKRAVVRILKKDVADLIAAGHESNAFGRMGALIVEMNRVFCYEMIEKFCECISNQLPTLQKQRDCPEESMEAISTLIYAAARFSDLPELRDLRSLFTERYGNCMESSVNAEFAEKTNRKSFPREWKLKVMQEIAEEFSLSWTGKKNQESRNLPPFKSAGQAQTNKKPRSNHDAGRKIDEKFEVLDIDPVKPSKPKPVSRNEAGKSGNRRVHEKRRQGTGATDELENQPIALLKPNLMNSAPKNLDGDSDTEKPKRFSVRKNLRKSAVNYKETPREEIDSKFLLRGLNGEKGQDRRKNAEAIQDERDDEEKILDVLLLYYSRKGRDNDTTQSHLIPRIQLPPPTRTSSWLASESVSPAETREPGPASSLRSDPTSRLGRSLVHPRLPDYDQLAARFAALKSG